MSRIVSPLENYNFVPFIGAVVKAFSEIISAELDNAVFQNQFHYKSAKVITFPAPIFM
jgi:hypothetical protein